MNDKQLQSFTVTNKLINNCKELFRKLFANKMNGIVLLSKKSFIATNVDLPDILTNTFSSSCAIHLVEILDPEYQETIETLLALNSDNNFSFISRDHFLSYLNHFERIMKFYSKVYKCDEEELKEVFSITPKRKLNGDVVIDYSYKLNEFLTICYHLFFENTVRKYNNDLEKSIYDANPKADVVKTMGTLYQFMNEEKKAKKISIAETSSERVLTAFLGTYIDHIREIGKETTIIEEDLSKGVNLFKQGFYFHVTKKSINKLFNNRMGYTLKLPMMLGINHPAICTKDNNKFDMRLCLWKEDNAIRHFVKFKSETFDIVSFLPFSIYYLPEGDLEYEH